MTEETDFKPKLITIFKKLNLRYEKDLKFENSNFNTKNCNRLIEGRIISSKNPIHRIRLVNIRFDAHKSPLNYFKAMHLLSHF